MTTENYMKRYHAPCCGEDAAELSSIPAEEAYPCACAQAPSCPWEPDRCPCEDGRPTPETGDDCCCKGSMVEALRLLCGSELSELVDFNSFFFLTDALTVGGTLQPTLSNQGPADNISGLDASLQRFSPCNCDLLEVEGVSYFAIPAAPAVAIEDVDALSLCALKAVAFQLTDDRCEEDECAQERRAIRLIRRAIRREDGDTGACGTCRAHCDCDNCCCVSGLLTELSGRNLSRQATLAAGPLLLRDVTVLGSVGSALVLWNENDRRVYFVCVNAVEALG